MWNVRMRASKTGNRQQAIGDRLQPEKIHISGAEGIYEEKDIHKICNEYIKRALTHPRGEPEEIVITIEKIRQKPSMASILPVTTLQCSSPDKARKTIFQRLSELDISKKAVANAFKVLTTRKTMRGASLILVKSGKRVEPDKERGIRVSRFGIEKSAARKLSLRLSKMRINTVTVKEALILASKTASHRDIIAEICISDDPDYTTGYIASKRLGYLRIPNIKRYREMHGGRVMFIKENTDIEDLIGYLEKKPILINIQGK